MGEYSDFLLTDLGAALLAKVNAGTTSLTMTKWGLGDGTLTWPDDVAAMTALASQQMTTDITEAGRIPDTNQAKVMGYVTVDDLPATGFQLREVGLFADDPDDGEILYGVIYGGDTGDYVPSASSGAQYGVPLNVILTVGTSATVTVEVDLAAAATKAELRNHVIPLNRILNPQFQVNQERWSSGDTLASAGDYFVDQWCAGVDNAAPTLSGDILTIPAGDTVKQIIEDINIPNGTYTLAWEGSAQASIDGGTASASPVTFDVTSGTHVEIEFGAGTLQHPRLVSGSEARPFIPRFFADELLLCQRYFCKSYSYLSAPGVITNAGALICEENSIGGTAHNIEASFPVTMRTIPSMAAYSPDTGAVGYVADGSITNDILFNAFSNLSDRGFQRVSISGSAEVTGGGIRIKLHYVADARL